MALPLDEGLHILLIAPLSELLCTRELSISSARKASLSKWTVWVGSVRKDWRTAMGKKAASVCHPLLISQLLEATKALKPCLLTGDFELSVLVGVLIWCLLTHLCFQVHSAKTPIWVSRRRGTWYFQELNLVHYLTVTYQCVNAKESN